MGYKVILIGAGRHAILIAEKIFEDSKLDLYGFIDKKNTVLPEFITKKGLGVLGDDDSLLKYKDKAYFHLSLGANLMNVRKRLIQQIHKLDLKIISIIHNSAYVAPSAKLGQGVSVLVNAVIHTNSKVGDFSCINTAAVVEHDCELGRNIFIQPKSVLAGGVTIGNNTVIGMGALIREGITIGKNCVIGGGSFVKKDIPDNSVAYGVPARVVEKKTLDEIKKETLR